MIQTSELSVDSGFLRQDGALVVRVDMDVKRKKSKAPQNVAADLLSLMDDPGPTSDLTLTAGGRSFPVHRAILAARCEFFKTMFASGFDDGAARELPMPDTDPDALQLLLRFIYGGILHTCPQALLKPAAELADRLRLTDARAELEDCILDGTGPGTIVDDMLWAERRGSDVLSKSLQDAYLHVYGKDVDKHALTLLAECSPKLAASLLSSAVMQLADKTAAY